jgi:hypothetical protein
LTSRQSDGAVDRGTVPLAEPLEIKVQATCLHHLFVTLLIERLPEKDVVSDTAADEEMFLRRV